MVAEPAAHRIGIDAATVEAAQKGLVILTSERQQTWLNLSSGRCHEKQDQAESH